MPCWELRAPWTCFNPHPARRPGATPRPRPTSRPSRCSFNPHPAFWPGATSVTAGSSDWYPRFQSSPGLLAGCNHCQWTLRCSVSILTRPSGRVQPPRASVLQTRSPQTVSILTRPSGRVRTTDRNQVGIAFEVSILTRPSGRVQPPLHGLLRLVLMRFNPHPAFWPGATGGNLPWSELVFHRPLVFQSSPGQKAGCNRPTGWLSPCTWWCVSILTRPSGRVQRPLCMPSRGYGFNPHPARRPGATRADGCCRDWFQSSPGQKAGCNVKGRRDVSILTRPEGRVQQSGLLVLAWTEASFNPHPARRPGATLQVDWDNDGTYSFQSSPGQKAGCNLFLAGGLGSTMVSILTRPEGRVQPTLALQAAGNWRSTKLFQSSPGQKAGCNHAYQQYCCCANPCFNPHPARRPGATRTGVSMVEDVASFQSSPGQKAGCNRNVASRAVSPWSFNPHPARRPGATGGSPGCQCRVSDGFNPHPARRPGAT